MCVCSTYVNIISPLYWQTSIYKHCDYVSFSWFSFAHTAFFFAASLILPASFVIWLYGEESVQCYLNVTWHILLHKENNSMVEEKPGEKTDSERREEKNLQIASASVEKRARTLQTITPASTLLQIHTYTMIFIRLLSNNRMVFVSNIMKIYSMLILQFIDWL